MKAFLFLLLLVDCMHSTAQNVGIGTTAPAHKLDVAGRMRLQNKPGQTAGIFLDGVTLPTRSFIGTIDDDHVGIYGGVSGWKFAMNVENGNVGIGTTAPTAGLDVNGSLRLRGSFPIKGSVLTSNDANGNANWADPIAFRATGLVGGANVEMPELVWTKVLFGNATYNLGLGYQPIASQFQATADGIYHFDAQLTYAQFQYTSESRVRLILNRGGTLSTIFEKRKNNSEDLNESNGQLYVSASIDFSADAKLIDGDIVWAEVYLPIFLFTDTNIERTSLTLLGAPALTWFNGHLVARN